MKRIFAGIEAISEWSGKAMSILVLFMIGLLLSEVLLRYIFNAPTIWAHQASSHLFAVYAILAGAYVLLRHEHVRVDLIYTRLAPRARAALDSFTYLVFFLFVGAMLVYGTQQAIHAIKILEGPPPPFIIPVWPIRITVPLGALLILLQGLAHWVRNLTFAFRGRELA